MSGLLRPQTKKDRHRKGLDPRPKERRFSVLFHVQKLTRTSSFPQMTPLMSNSFNASNYFCKTPQSEISAVPFPSLWVQRWSQTNKNNMINKLCCGAHIYLLQNNIKKNKEMQWGVSGDSYLNTAQTCWKRVPCSLWGASLCSWWTDAGASSALPCWRSGWTGCENSS